MESSSSQPIRRTLSTSPFDGFRLATAQSPDGSYGLFGREAGLNSITTFGNARSEEPEYVVELIMALDMKDNAAMGAATFSTEDGSLRLLHDTLLADLGTLEHLIIFVQPTTILVPATAPEILMTYLETWTSVGSVSEPSARAAISFFLRVMPSPEFSRGSSMDRLLDTIDSCGTAHSAHGSGNDVVNGRTLPTGEDLSNGVHKEPRALRFLRCGSVVDLNSRNSVNCAGAILVELDRRRSVGLLPDGQSAEYVFRVLSVDMFTLSDQMYISSDDLLSLQILKSENHPDSQSWGPDVSSQGSKESLSIYGLFHLLAGTPQGRCRLREVFLRPTLKTNTLVDRQRAIGMLLRPDNADRLKQLASTLRKIKNVKTMIVQLTKGADVPSSGRSFDKGVWFSLRQFSAQVLRLREVVASFTGCEHIAVLQQFLQSVSTRSLVSVGELINKTIDFDQSSSRQRASVRFGLDSQLDELKRRYDGMNSLLTEVVTRVNEGLPDWAHQYIMSCVFLPQLGFLMVVKLDPETGNGKYEGENATGQLWEKLFTTDGAACYKNRHMEELDECYGDIYCEIGDIEVEIIHGLTGEVLLHQDALLQASDSCAELDVLLALALGAEKYGWSPPNLTSEAIIDIEGGRHPLQELVTPSFVPNDCRLQNNAEGRDTRALVLTGPSHSGKSVYMKQTAIIVYLAHIGSYVPADRAVIGLTDKLLTRTSARECVSRNESAFAIDLQHILRAIKSATRKSLVLIDEFGKGTNADDGAGLLGAVLQHYASLGPDSPRLLIATHLHETMQDSFLRTSPGITVAHMEVNRARRSEKSDEDVTYLFRLREGHCSLSYGCQCAAENGVPRTVVERAEAIALLASRNEDLASACARLSSNKEHQLGVAEQVARAFLREDFNTWCWNGENGTRGEGPSHARLQLMLAPE